MPPPVPLEVLHFEIHQQAEMHRKMDAFKFRMTWLIGISSYKLDKATITNDLSKERPIWILSSYGPGREAPLQLFGGQPREQSFEEIRVRHHELTAQGNQQQAIQEYQTLVNNAEQQCQMALNDVDGAIKYIVNDENEHPNRNDICKAKGASSGQAQIPTPQQPAAAFGQPSAPSTFGKPAFGQPSAPASTFGQPSFGQPSAFGKSPLGQPTIAFGQPSSTFGKPSVPTSTFGRPSAPNSFGSRPQNPSSFGQPSAPMQPNPFRQPSSSTQPNPFGQPSSSTQRNPFGQSSAPTQSSPFATVSPFAKPAASGTSSAPAANPFGQPSAPQTTNTFEKPPTTTPNPFGQPTSTNTPSKLRTWQNKPITYIDDEPYYKSPEGHWVKIWFPNGPPVFTKSVELPEELYDEGVKEKYKYLKEHGRFEGGVIPELPPRREWVGWDF